MRTYLGKMETTLLAGYQLTFVVNYCRNYWSKIIGWIYFLAARRFVSTIEKVGEPQWNVKKAVIFLQLQKLFIILQNSDDLKCLFFSLFFVQWTPNPHYMSKNNWGTTSTSIFYLTNNQHYRHLCKHHLASLLHAYYCQNCWLADIVPLNLVNHYPRIKF